MPQDSRSASTALTWTTVDPDPLVIGAGNHVEVLKIIESPQ